VAEVERLKEGLAQKVEELAKEKDAFTTDSGNFYLVGFEDAIVQASGIYLKMDFSQLGPGKTVVDGKLVEEQYSLYNFPHFVAL